MKGPMSLAVAITSVDHTIGPKHARTTVVEYGDYECPTCAELEPAVRAGGSATARGVGSPST